VPALPYQDRAGRVAGRHCPLRGAHGGHNDFLVAVVTGDVAEVRLERRSRLRANAVK